MTKILYVRGNNEYLTFLTFINSICLYYCEFETTLFPDKARESLSPV